MARRAGAWAFFHSHYPTDWGVWPLPAVPCMYDGRLSALRGAGHDGDAGGGGTVAALCDRKVVRMDGESHFRPQSPSPRCFSGRLLAAATQPHTYLDTDSDTMGDTKKAYDATLERLAKIQSHLERTPRAGRLAGKVCIITGAGSQTGIGCVRGGGGGGMQTACCCPSCWEHCQGAGLMYALLSPFPPGQAGNSDPLCSPRRLAPVPCRL